MMPSLLITLDPKSVDYWFLAKLDGKGQGIPTMGIKEGEGKVTNMTRIITSLNDDSTVWYLSVQTIARRLIILVLACLQTNFLYINFGHCLKRSKGHQGHTLVLEIFQINDRGREGGGGFMSSFPSVKELKAIFGIWMKDLGIFDLLITNIKTIFISNFSLLSLKFICAVVWW